ncbi:inhibitor of sigma-G Gin [Paenibacillus sp. 7124]|uniref:Inhibitor of sigma-G Gin n=2 Tax=Paenibacillus TaxID=44249 RepID=A0A6M1PUP8_9BACL|nr:MULTISPECIES: sigma factor G inhibitor Gin [Paenibacillus]AHV94956.1 sigma-G inhibitor, Gin [Paenibacillus sabinae T27]NGM85443.1 inhibitor of sigma-G Gin [Paenibacillus apii]NJJ42290.1 inhibitor of sigma-G Gin [Paenibacillus apii]
MEQENAKTETCIICGQEKEEGIRIVSQFICEDCEAEMVRTEAEDAKYRFFIGRMKKIGLQKNA